MATSIALSSEDSQSSGDSPFHQALQRYWGYSTFRPRQEEIVRALAAGRDVCVVMPTGVGKSLCYQLPAALAAGRTAVVISPLIALMQDQVAHLTQIGVPAVFLNSSVVAGERSEIRRKVAAGEFRLLYLSPERLVLDTLLPMAHEGLRLWGVDADVRERFLGVMCMPINQEGEIESENLTLACRNAVLNMMEILQERAFSRQQAYVICSVAVDLRVSNVVDVPNYVVSALLPEAIFGD